MKSLTSSTVNFLFRNDIKICKTNNSYKVKNPITGKSISGKTEAIVKHRLSDELLTIYYDLYVVHRDVSNLDIDNRKQKYAKVIKSTKNILVTPAGVAKQKKKMDTIPIIKEIE